MRIVVTGASGQFGQLAVAGLLAQVPASDLILVTRHPQKLANFAARGAQVRYGDFDVAQSLPAAFAGGEKMLLISASRVGKRIPQHKAAIAAAVQAGVKHIVYTSFVGATDDNPSLAVSDHRGTEALLRTCGADWTALRNSHYADAIVQAIAPPAIKSGRWPSNAAEGKEAPVTRRDCVACAVAVLTTPGHRNTVYNITGPELLTFREAAAIHADVSGRPIEYIVVSDADMYAMFDSLGIPREPVDDQVIDGVSWCSDDMVSFGKAIREGGFAVISDDVRKLLGRAPQSLRSFALEHREMLRAL
jgi:NAD(P)H dehydrogenase (quinone)